MIKRAIAATSAIRRIVPVVTFIAGTITTAVGAHKILEIYSGPKSAVQLRSVGIAFGQGGINSLAIISFDKLREECTRESASIQFTLADGSTTGADVSIRGQFARGSYVVKGTFDGPRLSDIDRNKLPIYHAKYVCSAEEVTVSSCATFLSGESERLCEGAR